MILQYTPMFNGTEQKALNLYMKSGNWLTEYKETEKFEKIIAKYLNVKHCIVVNNGTISLSLALLAYGIKPGDRVLVPSLTMIATANAVKFIGAVPIFVDINPENLCMTMGKDLQDLINLWQPKALIYVALNGRRTNRAKLWTFFWWCKKHNIAIIEDNAQAFGSEDTDNTKIGNTDYISSFSFSVPKIISTGQGGALTTNDDDLALKLRRLKDFGRDGGGNDIHNYFGINSKFTDLQAVIGIEQMKNINWRVKRKKEIYNFYYTKLKDIPQIEFIPTDLNYVTPWFVDIYVKDREDLIAYLKINGIGTRAIYNSIYKQKIYQPNAIKHPIAEDYSNRGLWLPSSMTPKNSELNLICKKIKDYYSG